MRNILFICALLSLNSAALGDGMVTLQKSVPRPIVAEYGHPYPQLIIWLASQGDEFPMPEISDYKLSRAYGAWELHFTMRRCPKGKIKNYIARFNEVGIFEVEENEYHGQNFFFYSLAQP